jgi:glycosyltransferase involved in cell wall biosynthesis
MKICFFADSESIHTARWCAHFHSLGHEVHLISFKETFLPNIRTHTVNLGKINVAGGNWKVLLKIRTIRKIVKDISPDIFHALYATSYGITGSLVGFHPFIITALGSDILISPKNSKIYRYLLKFAFSKTDLITVMSDQMKSEIEKMGVSSAKICTLPFGIDPKIFNAINRKLDKDRFVITSTRNFENVYNIPHLIKAIAKVKVKIPNIKLNLIGAGSLEQDLKDLVKELNVEDCVTFFGKVPQSKIAEVLNQSHVFVSVSLSDGNNISLNEAMASDTLCIATNIPANTQWIQHNENGFLVAINDVDSLAEYLLEAFENYDDFQKKAIPINKMLIEEKGIWANNMKRMEDYYKELILKK